MAFGRVVTLCILLELITVFISIAHAQCRQNNALIQCLAGYTQKIKFELKIEIVREKNSTIMQPMAQ
jgi:hypothetical protein